jgi:high-affinity Fe2+/Pb2+ permease
MPGSETPPFVAAAGPYRFFRALRIRIVATIGIVFGALVAFVLYLGFWATRLAWFENLAVLFAGFLIVLGLVVGVWVSFGMGMFRRHWHASDEFERSYVEL